MITLAFNAFLVTAALGLAFVVLGGYWHGGER